VAEIGERGETSWLHPRVAPEKGYVYAITVVDRAGNESVPSNDRMAIARDLAAPAKPAEIVAVPSDRAVLLRFRASTAPDLEHYRVHMGEGTLDRRTTFGVIGRIAKRDTAYVEERIRDLKNGKPYHFYVTALDGAGNSRLRRPSSGPDRPDGAGDARPLEALAMNSALVALRRGGGSRPDILGTASTAKAPSAVGAAQVIDPKVKRRRASATAAGRHLRAGAIEFEDKGLVNGLRYRYRVTAVDRKGNESEPTESVDGVPEIAWRPPPCPTSPRNRHRQGGRDVPGLADRDLAGYVIRRRPGGAGAGRRRGHSPRPTRSKTQPGKVVWVDHGVVSGEASSGASGRDESGVSDRRLGRGRANRQPAVGLEDLPQNVPTPSSSRPVIAFGQNPGDRIEGHSFTPSPGADYRTFSDDGKTWRKWRPWRSKTGRLAGGGWSPRTTSRSIPTTAASSTVQPARPRPPDCFCFDRKEFAASVR
jgi:hypothetical protein